MNHMSVTSAIRINNSNLKVNNHFNIEILIEKLLIFEDSIKNNGQNKLRNDPECNAGI
jgi:hypothetical protein